MRSKTLILLGVVLALLLSSAVVSAASCPYCGRVYGEPAPGDEARVYGLRREHERTCPSRPRDAVVDEVKSYGAVTIYNPTDKDIKYKMQRTQGWLWPTSTVRAHSSYFHWQALPANFRITFDSSSKPGYQKKSYSLDHNVVTGRKPTAEDGRAYTFAMSGQEVDMHTASETAKQDSVAYGVVTIVNTSDSPINYQIKSRTGGAWGEVTTVEPHSSYYHWQVLPAKFSIKFDRSFAKGYQRKSIRLTHNTVVGRKPTAEDGWRYEFNMAGKKVNLKKILPLAAEVSLTGSGEGRTIDGEFGTATQARGAAVLTYMPRIGGVIPTESGKWKAEMIEDITSPANSAYKTQIWKFHSAQFGEATATIQGGPKGASGTATGWHSPVPGNPKAEKFQIKFGVEFVGPELLLKNFSKSY